MNDQTTVLVVDDNRSAADALGIVLRRNNYVAEVAYDGVSALGRLRAGGVDVVLTDLRMEPMDGIELLRQARALPTPPEVIVFTGFGTVDAAVEAMRLGARDFLTKPVSPSKVLEHLGRLRGDAAPTHGLRVDEGKSAKAKEVAAQVEAVRKSRAPVLILGEPGSGRSELARALHPSAAERPVRALNHPSRAAEVDLRAPGALLLPNVDLLTPQDQVALVQVLNGLDPVSGPRVIAWAQPGFIEHAPKDPAGHELTLRLAVLVVTLPPLRERVEDIPALLSALLAGRAPAELQPTDAQLQALMAHRWPGNLRELAALAERAVVFGASALSLPPSAPSQAVVASATSGSGASPTLEEGFSLQEHLESVEREILIRAQEQTKDDRAAMSRVLGVERNTLRYKLNKYHLNPKGGG
ncbi:MAG: sigma-54-dependent Fis family transcriptional regulator [Deltaproteobacteria bacterium]|nr:sigma-54-dependent Fis family transcriptional regulator [Deltaproteobacteria bacterium]